jgi:hypothetical protein
MKNFGGDGGLFEQEGPNQLDLGLCRFRAGKGDAPNRAH